MNLIRKQPQRLALFSSPDYCSLLSLPKPLAVSPPRWYK